MGQKRKREEQAASAAQDGVAVSDSKRTRTEHPSAAERRQLRSERKSKKAQAAREGAMRSKAKTQQLAPAPELVKADPATTRDLLTADFISLTDTAPFTASTQDIATDTPKVDKMEKKNEKKEKTKDKKKKKQKATNESKENTSSSRPDLNGSRAKRTSPRNLRKEAKAAKAKSAVLAEYGPEALVDAAPENANKVPINNEDNTAHLPRFICFVGNLPFDCTLEQLQTHFRALNPSQIRHATDKATGKSKGFAFLEFDQYDKMKTCLKVYHHSLFDPERTAKLHKDAFDKDGQEIKRGDLKRMKGRRINVELTAGGGGGGEKRKEKISKKNQKLSEQRGRRALAEAKEAKKAEKKAAEQKTSEVTASVQQDNAGIHPSRLKKMRQ